MPDYGSKVADRAVAETARKIHAIYERAAKDLKKKLSAFTARYRAKQKEMLSKLESGDITKAAYDSWIRGQVFIGNQWKEKLDQAVRIMEKANEEAAQVVSTGRLNVFAENYNYAAYELEKKAKGVVSFSIYNEKSAGRLIKKKPKMLPEWKIDEPKDYKWNRQKVENAVTHGIIQGESIDEITDRMVNALCTGNENKMRTFARTSMTGAQNAGRQEQMEDAEEEGIKVKKKWVATLDDRTRDTHQELDGMEVPVSEPFTVDGMEIMYPGDPSAAPELVYNCRCTMVEVYEGIESHSSRRAYYDENDEEYEEGKRKSYMVEDMTYKEWKAWKEGRNK